MHCGKQVGYALRGTRVGVYNYILYDVRGHDFKLIGFETWRGKCDELVQLRNVV